GARVQPRAVATERPAVTGGVEVKTAAGDARVDVDHRGVLVAVLGVPATRLEINLVHHFGIEQLVQAPRDSGGDGNAIHVVGILGVLAADMDFAGRGTRGAHDGLLQDLGRRVDGRPMIVVLREDLVPGPRVDGE